MDAYHARADRQVRQVLEYLARYHALVALELGVLAALAVNLRRPSHCPAWSQPALIGLTLFDLAVLGFDLNPAISFLTHAREPRVIARLRQELPPHGRALGVGEELPPNVLMRFGLSDVRNYDSVELTSSLSWFKSLYKKVHGSLSSRSEITWQGAIAARDRLIESGVGAIVGCSPPPVGTFDRVERVGGVWIGWLAGKPWADSDSAHARLAAFKDHGHARIRVDAPEALTLTLRETWDPGWKALLDHQPTKIQRKSPVFLNIEIPAGQHELILKYDPLEVRLGIALSFCSLVLVILVLTGNRLFWIPGITTAKGLDGAKPSG